MKNETINEAAAALGALGGSRKSKRKTEANRAKALAYWKGVRAKARKKK